MKKNTTPSLSTKVFYPLMVGLNLFLLAPSGCGGLFEKKGPPSDLNRNNNSNSNNNFRDRNSELKNNNPEGLKPKVTTNNPPHTPPPNSPLTALKSLVIKSGENSHNNPGGSGFSNIKVINDTSLKDQSKNDNASTTSTQLSSVLNGSKNETSGNTVKLDNKTDITINNSLNVNNNSSQDLPNQSKKPDNDVIVSSTSSTPGTSDTSGTSGTSSTPGTSGTPVIPGSSQVDLNKVAKELSDTLEEEKKDQEPTSPEKPASRELESNNNQPSNPVPGKPPVQDDETLLPEPKPDNVEEVVNNPNGAPNNSSNVGNNEPGGGEDDNNGSEFSADNEENSLKIIHKHDEKEAPASTELSPSPGDDKVDEKKPENKKK